jgi:crotonobetainyl-CoA:carnitine CoA-transferase CaiB-like acyl-CoA transferase
MKPLAGLTILAFEQYGAGPFGTQYLADFGAEVIKVEDPGQGGDYSRRLGPVFAGDPHASDTSLFFQSLNRNKKSLTLDLSRPEGAEILHRLAAHADSVANNLRGDVPEKLGITYAALKTANPRIVCAHCSAYGRHGERRGWPGFDYLMQAETGYFSLCGEPQAAPARFGLSVVDYMAGLSLAFALVSGVLAARTSGEGRDVDVNLFDTALFNLNYLAAWSLNSDYAPGRAPRSAHPTMVPCQLYRTSDGWIFLMCNKEKFWGDLCRGIGRPDLAEDARFADFPKRFAHRDLLTQILDTELSKRRTAEWLDLLKGTIPAAPVLDVRQALDNPYVTERQRLQTLCLPSGRTFRVLANPIATGGEKSEDRPGSALGADTDAVLSRAGCAEAEIAHWRKQGVI